MATATIDIKDFIKAIDLGLNDECCLLEFIKENAVKLEDLLEIKTKQDLVESEIDSSVISNSGVEKLYTAIKKMVTKLQTSDGAVSGDQGQTKAKSSNTDKDTTMSVGTNNNGNKNGHKVQNDSTNTIGGMTGLNNPHNLCFMNSAIQCLLHTPGFSKELIEYVKNINISKRVIESDSKFDEIANGNELESEENSVDKNQWWCKLKVGDKLDAFNTSRKNWKRSRVVKFECINKEWSVQVHYEGLSRAWDTWFEIPRDFDLIDPPNTHWRSMLKKNTKIDYYKKHTLSWCVGTIVKRFDSGPNLYEIKYGTGKYDYSNVLKKEINENGKNIISKLGTKTNKYKNTNSRDSEYSRLNPLRYIYGSNSHSNNNSNGNGSNGNSIDFYNAWLSIVDRVHIEHKTSTFEPRDIRDLMAQYNPELGDGGQHDAIEALRIILHGIEISLPDIFDYDSKSYKVQGSIFEFPMKETIYDKENYQWDAKTHDIAIIKKLKDGKYFTHETNLVSKYFDGIQVMVETCLNCGFQRRLYNKFRELLLPVSETFIKIDVLYFSLKTKGYNKITLKLPDSCNIELLKFLALCKIFKKANQFSESRMNQFEIIKLNKKINSLDDGFIDILDENLLLLQIMKGIESKDTCLVLIPNIVLDILPAQSSASSKVDWKKRDTRKMYDSLFVDVGENNKLLLCLMTLPQHQYTLKLLHFQLIRHAKRNKCPYIQAVINYIADFAKLYCNGKFCKLNLKDTNSDTFKLDETRRNEEKRNIIINFGDVGDSSNNNKNGEEKQDSAEIEKLMDSIMTLIDDKSESKAYSWIEGRIRKLSQEYVDRPEWSLSMLCDRNYNKCKNNSSLMLIALERLRSKFKKYKDSKNDILLSLQESINNIWKCNKLNNKNNNGRYFDNKLCMKLEDCWDTYKLETYVKQEDVTGEFKCKCDDCKYVQTRRDIVVLPKLLILSLERGQGSNKHDHRITFGKAIDFGTCGEKCSLRAVCNHFGGAKFGHYTAHVCKLGTKDKWYECDDSSAARSSHSCDNAIMMIYAKVE